MGFDRRHATRPSAFDSRTLRRWLCGLARRGAVTGAATGLTCFAFAQPTPAPSPTPPTPQPVPAQVAPVAGDAVGQLAAAEQLELQFNLKALRNSKLEFADRRNAAKILLAKGWTAVVTAFIEDLAPGGDPITQRAIARAIADTETPPQDFVPHLLKLLSIDNEELRKDVATALSQYDDARLGLQLAARSRDTTLPVQERVGAVRAMAEYRSKEIVFQLMRLIESPEAPIRQAAFASLRDLTGLTENGDDPVAWQKWWAGKRTLSPSRFLDSIVRSISARSSDQSARIKQLIEQLTKAKRDHYLAVAEDQRTGLLLVMLEDELAATRVLAAKLTGSRVVNAQSISDELRGSLRKHLDDESPEVRAAVAVPLSDLGDAPAAEMAIERLLREPDANVQAAYLTLLAQVPLPESVDLALQLISNPNLAKSAASCIASAADAGLLTDEQIDQARSAALAHLNENTKPEPAMLRLLGRIASTEDQATIVKYLDHEDVPIRLAAAETFMAGNLPLSPLLQRLDTPALTPIALAAAARHGKSPQTLLAMLQHEPADAELNKTWLNAVATIAARLTPEQLVTVDDALAGQPKRMELRERLLVAAVEPAGAAVNGTAEDPKYVELVLRLARLYLTTQRPAKAKAQYDKLEGRAGLDALTTVRFKQGRLEAYLASGVVNDAVDLATRIMQADASAPAATRIDPMRIADMFLDAAEQSLMTDGQRDRTESLLSHTERLFAAKLSDRQIMRLRSISDRAKAASTAAPAPNSVP